MPDLATEAIRLQNGLDRMRDDAVLAVVHGGDPAQAGAVLHKTFNPRSTKSYCSVAQDIAASLLSSGFRHVHVLPDGIDLGARLAGIQADLVWVNSGGVQGYAAVSHTPAMLELMGVPYVGHDPLNVSILDHKHVFKHVLQSLGIATAPFMTWDGQGPIAAEQISRSFGDHAGPFVVKPTSGRASQHVTVVDHVADLPDAMHDVYAKTLNTVLVESFLAGPEYAISVCGPTLVRGGQIFRTNEPIAFSAVERVLDRGERIFTSMDVKPITASRLRLLARDDRSAHLDLKRLAAQVYAGFNLGTLVRLDLRADQHGALHVLEANPKPDLKAPNASSTNIVSLGLPELGMTYDDLILSLLADRLALYTGPRRHAAPGLARFVEGLS